MHSSSESGRRRRIRLSREEWRSLYHVHLILLPSDDTGLSRAVGETDRRYSGYINARLRVLFLTISHRHFPKIFLTKTGADSRIDHCGEIALEDGANGERAA